MRLRSATTALLVIDLQNAFCHPQGARAAIIGAARAERSCRLVEPVLDLVAAVRAAGSGVWWTRIVNGPSPRRSVTTGVERAGGRVDLCPVDDWDAAFVEQVAPVVDKDPVIVKRRASAFFGTDLRDGFAAAGIDTVVLAGTTTSFCVEATARDAFAHDLGVIVVGDCVADTSDEAHHASLAVIDRFLGAVVDVAAIPGMLRA